MLSSAPFKTRRSRVSERRIERAPPTPAPCLGLSRMSAGRHLARCHNPGLWQQRLTAKPKQPRTDGRRFPTRLRHGYTYGARAGSSRASLRITDSIT